MIFKFLKRKKIEEKQTTVQSLYPIVIICSNPLCHEKMSKREIEMNKKAMKFKDPNFWACNKCFKDATK